MDSVKSQDKLLELIAALLSDIQTSHSEVYTVRLMRLDLQKLRSRVKHEGISFLTKTLPRLGKAFDRVLSSDTTLNAAKLGFQTLAGSETPMFMGSLFKRVIANDGRVLQNPCVTSITAIREIAYCFYKYELPFSPDDEQRVLDQFVKTESDISSYDALFSSIADLVIGQPNNYRAIKPDYYSKVIRKARRKLARVFSGFDPWNIHPRHGPGAVSTKERLWDKYKWTSVPRTLTDVYPFDAYFTASLGHICDTYRSLPVDDSEQYARVVLVPKDSRGPRLISCEPLVFQWIQQGLGTAVRDWIEQHPLTRDHVRFTDQEPNQMAALIGSITGRLATLDLKDASDRVTLGLVRLLFPEPLLGCLMASRSAGTTLPDNSRLKLHKFAPMGSNLCFPILAITIWVLLDSALDADSRERVYVYGDDVIVPTACAANAIATLESFGLLVNKDKSCTAGYFRESCGTDAYQGVNVTPIRFKTLWSEHRSPDALTSWVAYANSCFVRGYKQTYDVIVGGLFRIYGPLPEKSSHPDCISLCYVPEAQQPKLTRTNKYLQRRETLLWCVRSRPIHKSIDGWSMLLRFFAESTPDRIEWSVSNWDRSPSVRRLLQDKIPVESAFSVSSYTKQRSSILVRCWR
uniref:RNA-directed RNA polymerase n=1 Tax=Leviviridae sp. TaxID=2027243 RepID=A0A514CYX0_9VIRU|nr:MAG: RNA-dependent RNA polymerase [Leviviridae sp.]